MPQEILVSLHRGATCTSSEGTSHHVMRHFKTLVSRMFHLFTCIEHVHLILCGVLTLRVSCFFASRL